MQKAITIIDETNNKEVTLTVTTKAQQTTLLRIASISHLKAVVEPDPSGDDTTEY